MIRQTITCDICSIERKQSNHWFEAYEHEGELRIRGLVPTKVNRPGLRHLCGQTCLHRLVDDFMAGNLCARLTIPHEEVRGHSDSALSSRGADAFPSTLVSDLAFESSARLIQPSIPQLSASSFSGSRGSTTLRPVKPSKESLKPSVSTRTADKRSRQTKSQRVAKIAPSSSPASVLFQQAGPSKSLNQPGSPPAAVDLPPSSQDPIQSIPSISRQAVYLPIAAPGGPLSPTPRPVLKPNPSAPGSDANAGSLSHLSASSAFPLAVMDQPSRLSSQSRRAQAWERERARERQSAESGTKATPQKFI